MVSRDEGVWDHLPPHRGVQRQGLPRQHPVRRCCRGHAIYPAGVWGKLHRVQQLLVVAPGKCDLAAGLRSGIRCSGVMKRPVIGIVTTWFERGAAYVSRAYRDALSESCEVRIYARGGEQCARGDPWWDDADVWWALPGPGRELTAIDRSDFERWFRERRVELVLFNEQQWWPPVLWARERGARTVAYVDYYTPE